MSKRLTTFSLEDQIAAIEWCCFRLGGRKAEPGTSEYNALSIMRTIATEMKAQRPGKAGLALSTLQRRLADAAASMDKNNGAFSPGALIGLGQDVIGYWPTIWQALERFEKDAQEQAEPAEAQS